jgi:hypothetical protein
MPGSLAPASAFSVDAFIECAQSLFPRYARLGFLLMGVYLLSGGAYLTVLARTAGNSWGVAALVTAAFVSWITFVNLVYLLTQIVIAADDCPVGTAGVRVVTFLRRRTREVGGVFLVILGLVVLATGASVLATGALWLVGFVPFIGLTVLPLQLLAWVLRGLVFQFIALASVGAYLKIYRTESAETVVQPAKNSALVSS